MADWQPPIPFHRFNLPPFPLEALPGWFGRWIRAEATETQTPPDLAAMVALSTVATAMAKKAKIHIKANWSEPLNIYTLTVLPPGNRKSAVFRDAIAPLNRFTRDEARRLSPQIKEAAQAHRIATKRLKKAEEAAAKALEGDEREELERQAKQLAEELESILVPVSIRLIADDATPERLVSLMAMHGGRMAVLSAEGGIFGMLAGRYSKDGNPNFEVFLKAWGGDDIMVDRVGRPPEHITEPALTVGLTVQPVVIQGLMEKAGFLERGLPARFFFSVPPSTVGYREINPPAMPPEVHSEYQQRLRFLLELTHDTDENGEARPHDLLFPLAARSVFDRFQAELEPRLRQFSDLEVVTEWAAKLAGGVGRIVGLLHAIEHAGIRPPWEASIRVETVDNAIRVGHYLVDHAKAAFAQMGADRDLEQAKRILKWVEKEQLRGFSLRELFEAMKGRCKKVEDLAPPMARLLEHGYIRRGAEEDHPGPGRKPSPEFEVNPLWHSQNSHNSQNHPGQGHSANTANIANGIPDENEGGDVEPDGDEEVEI